MAQRDYVRRGQSAPSRGKKSASRKKQRHTSAVSPAMVALATAALVVFIGGLYFITHHKKETPESLQNHKVVGNGLPEKPEERWRYIKELERRHPGVQAPTDPAGADGIINSGPLTDEQRQLLAQMQADMRQQPLQLEEVAGNGQAPEQQQRAATPSQSRTAHSGPVAASRTDSTPPYQDLLPTPGQTTATLKERQAAPVTRDPAAAKPNAGKKEVRRWMVQCGSFQGLEQAETVRAQLAFAGFDSRITTSNGWNRVMIGPMQGKENADSAISRLKMSGYTNCIRLAAGG